jgi:hypothetical protein
VVRDDDADRVGRRLGKGAVEVAELAAVDRAVRPVAIGERPARGVEAGQRDGRLGAGELEEGLDVGRDVAAIEAVGIEEARTRLRPRS